MSLAGIIAALQGSVALPVWIVAQVCLFSFGLRRPWRTTAVAAAALAACLYGTTVFRAQGSPLAAESLLLLTWTAAVAGCAVAVKAQRRNVQNLIERSAQLILSREREVELRVVEERLRIARDLHDVVAHNIAAISVQAGAAKVNLRTNPVESERSLAVIRSASRDVLVEIQEILAILRREEDDDDDVQRTAGLGAVVDLLRSFDLLGLTIESDLLTIEAMGLVDNATGVAVYRVLQEGLTNAHKHGLGHARVRLALTDDALVLQIENARSQWSEGATASSSGFGLIGIRERVRAQGGETVVTERPSMFLLEVTFPVARAAGCS
ncbi:sensor histidine kinase [Frondihabitans sp. 762G35]|uniref:sensor histidine kinase n=1 Tax=Frondihabitans sp. 762G35 TaxID=1446794 RepID=UPI0013D97F96|nr:histidine kinase [Frondihabitans sp. 762G35]